jgi:hypothetical protein
MLDDIEIANADSERDSCTAIISMSGEVRLAGQLCGLEAAYLPGRGSHATRTPSVHHGAHRDRQ